MTLTLPRSAAGLALLAVLAAGCGTAAGAHHGSAAPPVGHSRMHASTHPAAPAQHDRSANPIPQGNGGDHDPDNNGGPSDGDGNL